MIRIKSFGVFESRNLEVESIGEELVDILVDLRDLGFFIHQELRGQTNVITIARLRSSEGFLKNDLECQTFKEVLERVFRFAKPLRLRVDCPFAGSGLNIVRLTREEINKLADSNRFTFYLFVYPIRGRAGKNPIVEALSMKDKSKFTDDEIKEAGIVLEDVDDIIRLDLEPLGFTWSIDLGVAGSTLRIKAVISSSSEVFRTRRDEFFECMERIEAFSRVIGWKTDVIGGGIHGSGTRFTYSILLRSVIY